MLVPYNFNIPAAPNNPAVDQPKMQTNTNNVNTILIQDHIGFEKQNGGRHKVVHTWDNVTDPAPTAGFGQYYSKTVGSDILAFYESALGVITQLTGPTAPSASANGYVYLGGGLLLQWGIITNINFTDFVPLAFSTANINFPNNCFGVFCQIFGSSTKPSGAATVEIQGSSVNRTGFNWYVFSNSSQYTGFYWWAIGN